MLIYSNSTASGQPKPRRRVHKDKIDPVAVVSEAARVGDSHFQRFVETGKLQRSPRSQKARPTVSREWQEPSL
ncbi:hypothetical protein C7534_13819 [Pseudomonas sp. OV226]|nr:hypothetical protein C7534_13819 [Pseudomonas sp. OV226]